MLKLNEINQNSTVFVFVGNIAWNNQNSYLTTLQSSLLFRTSLQGRCNYFHFIDEEIESQKM